MKRVKVKRFDKRPANWNGNGAMDYLMGQEVNVLSVNGWGITIADINDPTDWWELLKDQYEPIDIKEINEPELHVLL
jgi:hypothetical protein